MCLYCTKKEAKISDKDIICYKILIETSDCKLYTPYQYTEVQLGTEVEAEGKEIIEVAEDTFNSYFSSKMLVTISGGFIHGFTNDSDSLYMDIDFTERKLGKKIKNYIMVECTIPKGTPYYMSFDGAEICTKKLRYGKKIVNYL